MAQLSHQKSENANVKVTYASSCGGSARVQKHLRSALVTWLSSPHAAEPHLTVPLELGKEEKENHDNLAGNRVEAKEAKFVKGGMSREALGRDPAGPELGAEGQGVRAEPQACARGTAVQRGESPGPCGSLPLGSPQVRTIARGYIFTSRTVAAAREDA